MQNYNKTVGSAFDENKELCLHCEHIAQCAFANTDNTPATRAFACAAALVGCMQFELEWIDGELIFKQNPKRKKALQSLSYEALVYFFTAAKREEQTPETKKLLLKTIEELQNVFPKNENAEIKKTEEEKGKALFANTAMQAEMGGGNVI